MTAEKLFWSLAADLRAADSRIVESTIMNGRCLRVQKPGENAPASKLVQPAAA